MFEQLIATGHFWHPTCWLDVLNVGWLQLFPHQSVKRLRREAGESGLGVRNSHLLCVWAWVNSIIIFEALIMCSSVGRAVAVVAAAGPPCFRQQVQLTIWQLTPMEGVIQSSRGWVDPERSLRAVQAKANKPANLWHRRRGKTTWRRRWRRGRWGTDASTLFSLGEVGQTCCLFSSRRQDPVTVKNWLSLCNAFLLRLSESPISTTL